MRKVVEQKSVDATIPKGNMGYDQYTVPDTVAVCCFPLALANMLLWSVVPFSQISLRDLSESKTTHNIFRGCRMHFFRQPFAKELFKRHHHTPPQPANFFVSQSWITDAPSVDFVAPFTFTAWWITQRIYIAVKFIHH